MDAPIAPSAVRTAEEGPAYDLISLGLVVFTILLVAVWTTHYFREAPFDNQTFKRLFPSDMPRTSAANLEAARWADFNLRVGPDDFTNHFRDHLKAALALELEERAGLRWKVDHLDPETNQRERVEAMVELYGDPDRPNGPVAAYLRRWYQQRSAWIDARDQAGFNVAAHRKFAILLDDLGMAKESDLEIDKIRRARPDLPVLPITDEPLPSPH